MSSGAFYAAAAAAAAAADRRNSVPDTTPTPGDAQTYDMQGTAAAQPAAYVQTTGLEGNMAELLEAAAKATTESQRHAAAQQQQQLGGGLRKVARITDLRGTAIQDEALAAAWQKRKRTTTPPGEGSGDGGHANDIEGEGGRAGSQSPRKRARQTPTAGTAEMQHHGPSADIHHYQHQQQSPSVAQQYQQQNHQQQQQHQAGFGITDARVVGMHSAAALFRQPSAASPAKKHTRPPMSKLFSSLQLTPENFLRLQAAAKTYMLDETHPERQSCVGSRGKGDTDMVKLRLFNCCRDFLNDNIGERFFGPDVPAPTENEVLEGETMPGRKWVWPRDGNKIVSLVTPLLRRMVTNERQRQYAQETRKGTGKRKSDVANSAPTGETFSSQDATAVVAAAAATTPLSTVPFDTNHSSPPNPAIDPSLSTPQPLLSPVIHPPPPNQQPQHAAHALPQPPPYGPPPTQYPRFLQTQPPQSIYSTALPTQPTAANSIQQYQYQRQHQQQHFHQPQLPPDQNVIQVLVTKNNTKLLPRIDMPSWPSTPHHTLPLADLRRAVEEEIRGLLKRGLDLGIRRWSGLSQQEKAGEGVTAAAAESQQPADVDVAEVGDEQQRQPEKSQQEEGSTNNTDGGVANNVGKDAAQQQQQQQQQRISSTTTTQPSASATDINIDNEQEEPSLEGLTLEIRALTGRGLVLIVGDDEWRAVLAEVGRAVWMEGVLRVVVEVI